MHMYNFLCSDSLLYIYFFLFLSTLHGVYTRDCSWDISLQIALAHSLTPYLSEIYIYSPSGECARVNYAEQYKLIIMCSVQG